jgi:hypothetical protein
LIITGPDDIRGRFTGQAPAELVAELAALRPRPGSMVRYHTLLALRELGLAVQGARCRGMGHNSGRIEWHHCPAMAHRWSRAPAILDEGRGHG